MWVSKWWNMIVNLRLAVHDVAGSREGTLRSKSKGYCTLLSTSLKFQIKETWLFPPLLRLPQVTPRWSYFMLDLLKNNNGITISLNIIANNLQVIEKEFDNLRSAATCGQIPTDKSRGCSTYQRTGTSRLSYNGRALFLPITATYCWHPEQLITVNWRWKREGIRTLRFLYILTQVVYLATLSASQSLQG